MLTIGIDIDGMLKSYPDFFETFIPAMQSTGNKVGILTGRSEKDKEHIAAMFEEAGLKMDFYIFKPDEFKKMPNGVWKAAMCRIFEIDFLYDDMQHNDPTFISDFSQTVGKTVLFTSFNYKSVPDASGDTLKDYVEEIIAALAGKGIKS